MSDLLTKFDSWLKDDGPVAVATREPLVPVEGEDGVTFPATFAAAEDARTFAGGYNIDVFPDGRNVCVIDSVGSQANRIEPIFAREPYRSLVPQVVVKAGTKVVNLLDAGHRAGDAIVRCSGLKQVLKEAFVAAGQGDAMALAKVAPTSLVFGVWDSRDTQVKLPRLIASTIRAYDVRRLTRSAQYVPAAEYVEQGLLEEPANEKVRRSYAERGFVHVPASGSPGGVIADGGIRRDASLQLAALRHLEAGADPAGTLALRRYILGLGLVAFTAPSSGYLRQGCSLVRDTRKPTETAVVLADGARTPLQLTHQEALGYAQAAAKAFGVGADCSVDFDPAVAKADAAGDEAKKDKKAARAKDK